MSKYNDASWLENNVWGKWGKDDEIGVLNEVTAADVLKAVSFIKKGKVYDLETLRYKGMPTWPGHCSFDLLTYASPRGRRNMINSNYNPAFNWTATGGWLGNKINEYDVAANTEMMIAPLHMGTHIDGLCHITVGKDAHWYNGFSEEKDWSDFGPLKADASTIPPIVIRGVLLDIAGYKGVAHLEPGESITSKEIEECAKWANIELQKNDAVFMRTGERWPEMDLCPGAGLSLEGARYLIEEKGAALLGNDQIAFESFPEGATSSYPGHVHPVHHYLLIQQGVHFIEMVQLDELATDKVYEFCFILASSKIKGGTGMFVRPLAIG